jgi:hypothetical protein
MLPEIMQEREAKASILLKVVFRRGSGHFAGKPWPLSGLQRARHFHDVLQFVVGQMGRLAL